MDRVRARTQADVADANPADMLPAMTTQPAGVRAADLIEAALAGRTSPRRPFVLGICGAQGSGKSTVAAELARRFAARGKRCALLSLDDLYLDGAARQRLAQTIHPLLRTRGVPGTHDIAQGLAVLDALGGDGTVMLPRFDKARDEPGAPVPFAAPADLLILEGWCVGARPEPAAALAVPVNALERDHDPHAVWRTWVDRELAGPYRALFERIDFLAFLAAPDFQVVADWRIEQERRAGGPMTDAQVRDFVEHYRRLTLHMLRHGPQWADLTISLDAARRPMG
jgi:D-glycerate 3-kinase